VNILEAVLNLIYWIFVITFIGAAFFLALPVLVRLYAVKHPSKKTKGNLNQLVQSFNSAKTSDELGGGFGELVRLGFFQCLKTGNHGKTFPDEKQYQGFLRFATPEIAKALKDVGDALDQYKV
jgi:hypothetical protein